MQRIGIVDITIFQGVHTAVFVQVRERKTNRNRLSLGVRPTIEFIFIENIFGQEHHLDIVTNAGYLPVTTEAFSSLFKDLDTIEKESYRSVYRAVDTMLEDYSFYALPLYDGASGVQLNFEKNVKAVLSSAHNLYVKRVANGEDPDKVLNELVESSLTELKALSTE